MFLHFFRKRFGKRREKFDSVRELQSSGIFAFHCIILMGIPYPFFCFCICLPLYASLSLHLSLSLYLLLSLFLHLSLCFVPSTLSTLFLLLFLYLLFLLFSLSPTLSLAHLSLLLSPALSLLPSPPYALSLTPLFLSKIITRMTSSHDITG